MIRTDETFAQAGHFIVAVALVVSCALLYGRENIWNLIAGQADLGPVVFGEIRRPETPNSYLMCPAELCANSKPDAQPPEFAVPVARLSAAARAAWLSGDMVRQVALSSDGLKVRYVQRSHWLRFPDTVSVRLISRGDRRSTLAIYSRSQIGHSDLGANEKRVEAWIERLEGLPRVK